MNRVNKCECKCPFKEFISYFTSLLFPAKLLPSPVLLPSLLLFLLFLLKLSLLEMLDERDNTPKPTAGLALCFLLIHSKYKAQASASRAIVYCKFAMTEEEK